MGTLSTLLLLFILGSHSTLVCADVWAALNSSFDGRLEHTEPFARPCFGNFNGAPVTLNEESCDSIRTNYTTNQFRDSKPGAYIYLQSEGCLSDPDDACSLDANVLPAALPDTNRSCNQGNVPDFYIEVQTVTDVLKAFNFVRTNNIPLSIKNSGHDFMMRSSQKGSLQLWVHHLKGLSHHENFIPDRCQSGVGRAMTVAAGETTNDVYTFAAAHGSTFIGGYSPTLAVSGGWVQGGGHSVLSPVYGLGADRVVQFRVVTPDGVLRTANACQNQDLFWALRGGGGGTFGVVLEATHRVEPVMPIAVVSIKLPSNISMDTSIQWLELLARESLDWGRQGWGGHITGLSLTYVNSLPTVANISSGGKAVAKSMHRATEFALSVRGTSEAEVLPGWLDVWNKYALPGTMEGAGQFKILTSRLLPRKMFAAKEGIANIVSFLSSLRDLGLDPRNTYIPVTAPYVADTASRCTLRGETSVHPAWYEAHWEFSNNLPISWNSTYDERLQSLFVLANATRQGQRLTGPKGGTYGLEAYPFTHNWQPDWWGSNYGRLLEVKKKYDPEGRLKCWKCVGFEDEDISGSRFRCQGKLQEAIDQEFAHLSPSDGDLL